MRTIFGSKLPSRSRGTLDLHRADVGGDRLGAGPVAGVPAVAPDGLVGLIADVLGHLGFQAGLEDHLRQPAQQPVRPAQSRPFGPGLRGELPSQLLVELVPTGPTSRRIVTVSVTLSCFLRAIAYTRKISRYTKDPTRPQRV